MYYTVIHVNKKASPVNPHQGEWMVPFFHPTRAKYFIQVCLERNWLRKEFSACHFIARGAVLVENSFRHRTKQRTAG